MTKEELIAFEKDIADEYCAGKIRAPIHLSDGNEEQLIEMFKMIDREDWVYSTWRSHYHCLLKGVPKQLLKQKIMDGDSITLSIKDYLIFSSAIVGGIIPIAMGTALGIKRQFGKNKVFCFVGDMTSKTGAFYESYQYAINHDLPIIFILENNSQSVGTPTDVVWGIAKEYNQCTPCMPFEKGEKLWEYRYNSKYPHVGAGKYVIF